MHERKQDKLTLGSSKLILAWQSCALHAHLTDAILHLAQRNRVLCSKEPDHSSNSGVGPTSFPSQSIPPLSQLVKLFKQKLVPGIKS